MNFWNPRLQVPGAPERQVRCPALRGGALQTGTPGRSASACCFQHPARLDCHGSESSRTHLPLGPEPLPPDRPLVPPVPLGCRQLPPPPKKWKQRLEVLPWVTEQVGGKVNIRFLEASLLRHQKRTPSLAGFKPSALSRTPQVPSAASLPPGREGEPFLLPEDTCLGGGK